MITNQNLISNPNISPNLENNNSMEWEAIYDRYAIVMGSLIKEAEEIIKDSKKEMIKGHAILASPPNKT
jgi:hypothetical protein